MTLVLGIEEQQEILDMQSVLGALEILYSEEANGRALNRQRSDTIVTNQTGIYGLKSMDGVVPIFDVGAVRINSDVITWPEINGTKRRVKVPAAPGNRWVGLILLFSVSTGEPLAIFPDGFIQKMRVGGTSGLGVKYMSRTDSKVLGIIGSGWQASAQLSAACQVRDFEKAYIYSPTRDNLEKFIAEMSPDFEIPLIATVGADEVVEKADVLLCATNSLKPVIDGTKIRPGQHLGSIKPCEFDSITYQSVDRLAIHTRNTKPLHEVMDTVDMEELADDQGWSAFQGAINWDEGPTIAQIIAGKQIGRKRDNEITCFVNNLGMGIQFAAVGAKVLELARAKGVGHELPTEWFTQSVHP